MTAVTALTAQNTVGVQGVEAPPVSFVATQMESVLSDIGADALKTGMVPSRELAKVVATAAARAGLVHSRSIVVDPVLVTSTGALLVPPSEVGPIARWLFPLAEVVTPNLPEAQVLLGMRDGEKIGDVPAMRAAARRLHALGPRWVLLKGGHLESADESVDVLFGGGDLLFELRAPRVDTRNTHGTGCTLGSSVAALLSRGHAAIRAAALAKRYVHGALCASAGLRLGAGHGALHHSHASHRWPPPPPIVAAAAAHAPKPTLDLGVYVITDAKLNAKHGRSLRQAVEAAIAGGATIIQLREKNIDSRPFVEAARECVVVHAVRIEHIARTHPRDLQPLLSRSTPLPPLTSPHTSTTPSPHTHPRMRAHRQAAAGSGVPVLINDRIDVALASGAAGVHLGQTDMDAATARSLLGPQKIVGVTAKTPELAREAVAAGADYVGCGAVYPTSTKDSSCIGLPGLAAVCAAIAPTPVVGIGGVVLANAAEVVGAGAGGVAVVSAVFDVADVASATRALRRVVVG